jgi:hypothetical protein
MDIHITAIYNAITNRRYMMDSRKSQAEVYGAIALGVFGIGFQTPDWHGILLVVFGILFALCFLLLALSLRFKWGWLNRFAGRLSEVQYGHLVLFLGLSGLALTLAQKGYTYASIAVFVVGYGALMWGFIPRRTTAK